MIMMTIENHATLQNFDIQAYDIDIQEIYSRTISENPEYKNIIEYLLNPKVSTLQNHNRKQPKYIGVGNDGMPVQPKILNILKRILSGDVFIVNFEGGVRGGKDLWAIYMWTKYLMVCPEPIHLVLGKSLEHALINVLHSNGFGLFYTIPNGVFERTSDKGAQRGVFRFVDAYGRNKEILFYGNDKENDHEKFQGFTIGSTYVVEGMTQHINGLNQAVQRMASTKQHLMILTQNPKGEGNKFYSEFEKSKLYTNEEIELLEFIRDTYKDNFLKIEAKNKEQAKSNAIKVRDAYYKKVGVPQGKAGYEFLSNNQQVELQLLLYENNLKYDSMIRSIRVSDFQKDLLKENNPTLIEDHKFAKLSMKKVVTYFRGGDNPNMISNAVDYEYYHFTINDNLAMDEMARSEFSNQFAKGSAVYDRNVRGIRRTTDGAVFSNFSLSLENGNVFTGDIEQFDNKNFARYIAIDFGLNHACGIIDGEIDLNTGTFYQLQEALLELKGEDSKGLEYIYNRYLEIVRRRKREANGRYKRPDYLIADPSNTALIIYFLEKGEVVKRANNSVWSARSHEKVKAVKTEKKDLIGIDLMQTVIGKRKYLIHDSNKNTIKQLLSYESYVDEKTGETKVFKVADDLVDPVRYAINTLHKPYMLGKESERDERREAKPRKSKWEIYDDIQKALADDSEDSGYARFGININSGLWD